MQAIPVRAKLFHAVALGHALLCGLVEFVALQRAQLVRSIRRTEA